MPVLAADTTVALANEMLAKPADAADAARMLRLLSGTRHRVLTAVAVAFDGRVAMRVSESLVTFCPLDEARIDAYVASGEPFDKAGGYGIQGRAGAFVEPPRGQLHGRHGAAAFRDGGAFARIRCYRSSESENLWNTDEHG